jgi:hypothetical protein
MHGHMSVKFICLLSAHHDWTQLGTFVSLCELHLHVRFNLYARQRQAHANLT